MGKYEQDSRCRGPDRRLSLIAKPWNMPRHVRWHLKMVWRVNKTYAYMYFCVAWFAQWDVDAGAQANAPCKGGIPCHRTCVMGAWTGELGHKGGHRCYSGERQLVCHVARSVKKRIRVPQRPYQDQVKYIRGDTIGVLKRLGEVKSQRLTQRIGYKDLWMMACLHVSLEEIVYNVTERYGYVGNKHTFRNQ